MSAALSGNHSFRLVTVADGRDTDCGPEASNAKHRRPAERLAWRSRCGSGNTSPDIARPWAKAVLVRRACAIPLGTQSESFGC